ncbi:MAG: carbon-nitrogen hydrolase family protein [Verrucomicrobiota bacterium]
MSSTSRSFRLALCQMRVLGGRKDANLDRAAGLVATAAQRGAQVVVLPETMTLGWTHSSAATAADAVPDGQACRFLRDLAQRHGVFLCSGLVERAGDKIFNAALLIDPRGDIILHHRKINELDIAHHVYALGDRLGVAPTPFGKIGVMICADAFARGQVISRALGMMGAQIILSPCAWAVPADHDNHKEPYGQLWLDNYQPVARDFQLWIAGVSNVGWIDDGPWKGRPCIGCSLVIGPDGREMARGPYGADAETVLYAEIN